MLGPLVRLSSSVARKRPTENSRVSPGRKGKSSPHSMKTMIRLIHTNSVWKFEQPVRIHPGDAEEQGLQAGHRGEPTRASVRNLNGASGRAREPSAGGRLG